MRRLDVVNREIPRGADIFIDGNPIPDRFRRVGLGSEAHYTAADPIKLAMVRIDRALNGCESRLLLQVHDELVLEAPEAEVDQVKALVKAEMEGVSALSVPLLVEVGTGVNWRDAK